MRSRKLYSVGFMSVLVVLAAVSAGGFAGMNTNLGASVQDDTETEPNDDRQNATPIGPNVDVSGETNASPAGNSFDKDWFKFEASAGQAIRFAYSSNPAGGANNITLYDPDGNVVDTAVMSEPDVFATGAVAEKTGTYHVRVVNQEANSGSSYHFTLETAAPDAFESNDDRASAAPLVSEKEINAKAFEDNHDWYKIDAKAGQNLTARLELTEQFADPGQNLRVDVFNSDGNRVGTSAEQDNPVSGENRTEYDGGSAYDVAIQRVTDTQAGTYYVRVTGLRESSDDGTLGGFQSYALTVTTNGASQPTDTPNETTDTETPEQTTDTPTETTPTEESTDTDTETTETSTTEGDSSSQSAQTPAQGSDIGQNDKDDDNDGHVDEDGEDGNDVPSNDDDDGDGAVDEDDEPDDGDDGSDDFNGNAEDDDDGDGHFDEDDENDGGNSDDEDNDGDGAVDEDDEDNDD